MFGGKKKGKKIEAIWIWFLFFFLFAKYKKYLDRQKLLDFALLSDCPPFPHPFFFKLLLCFSFLFSFWTMGTSAESKLWNCTASNNFLCYVGIQQVTMEEFYPYQQTAERSLFQRPLISVTLGFWSSFSLFILKT